MLGKFEGMSWRSARQAVRLQDPECAKIVLAARVRLAVPIAAAASTVVGGAPTVVVVVVVAVVLLRTVAV